VSQFGWSKAPADVRKQIERITQGLEDALPHALVGVYLHGSLALGCFNRELSDVDLVVTRRRTTEEEQRQTIALLLGDSGERVRRRLGARTTPAGVATACRARPRALPR
jgi:predicted nucleotidyltransferase